MNLIRDALKEVAQEYFKIITINDSTGNARERVFCYELYHQMRLKGVVEEGIVLHGELDKAGHQDFKDEKPDFLFHTPGTHDHNRLVIEVKGELAARNRHRYAGRDINKLLLFVEAYHYSAGLFILFNFTIDKLLANLHRDLPRFREHPAATAIHVVAIPDAYSNFYICKLSELGDPGQ